MFFYHKVSKNFDFNFAFKFQYRNLDTLIHPDYKDRMDLKYVKRFSETKLTEEEFLVLKKEVEERLKKLKEREQETVEASSPQ